MDKGKRSFKVEGLDFPFQITRNEIDLIRAKRLDCTIEELGEERLGEGYKKKGKAGLTL